MYFTLSQRTGRVIAIRYLPQGIEQNSRKISLFIPENIFSGPKLYSPMHLPSFQAKQKIHMFNFSRLSHLKTTAATLWWTDFPNVLLKCA